MSAPNKHSWIIFAISSGACAAINGVFAKLTTGTATSAFAATLAHIFGLDHSTFFEVLVRASCFGLNLLFDAIMWGLFTRALTLAASTVHVSVLNTSTNFLVAAMAGLLVFGERLPGLWWVGAAMLVAGCLLIGGREGGKDAFEHGHGGGSSGVEGQELHGEGEAVGLDEIDDPDDPLPAARSRSPYRDSMDEGEGESARL